MTPKETIKEYMNLRMELYDLRAHFKDEEMILKNKMEALEGDLKTIMDSLGVDSLKTEFGTAYLKMTSHVSTADKSAFLDYVKNTGQWDLLDIRGSKTSLESFIEENQVIPPGIDVYKEQTVGIRKA